MRDRIENAVVSCWVSKDTYVNEYVVWDNLCDIARKHTGNPKEGDTLTLTNLGSSYMLSVVCNGDRYYISFSDLCSVQGSHRTRQLHPASEAGSG